MKTRTALLLCIAMFGQALAADEKAPLPRQLLEARTAFLADQLGNEGVFNRLYSELKKWGRFELVQSREAADIVISVSLNQNRQMAGSVYQGTGSVYAMNLDELSVVVTSADGGDPLWNYNKMRGGWLKSGASDAVKNLRKRIAEEEKRLKTSRKMTADSP